jgi:hypothetical protein
MVEVGRRWESNRITVADAYAGDLNGAVATLRELE